MGDRLRSLAFLAVLTLAASYGLVAPPAAQAQEPEDDPAAKEKAREFMDAGDKLMAKGDAYRKRRKEDKARESYERALEAYSRAYDSFPSPKIYWLIGLAEQKLEKHLDALRHFNQVLKEEPNLSAELKTQIEAAIEESKARVVTVTFNVEPPGARIAVDGEDVGTAPYEDPVYLAAGDHTFAVTFEGYAPFEDSATLEAGQESERTVSLEKIPVVVEKPRPRPHKPKAAPTVGKGPLIAGITFTGGFATIATITGLIAVSKHGTFTDENAPQDQRDAARSSGKNLALVTDLLWVGAIGAGAYTAYYYYKVYKPKKARLERQRSGAAGAWLAPWSDGRRAGVAVGGSF